MLYSGFNTIPRSVFWSANFNGRSDNLDVIPLGTKMNDKPNLSASSGFTKWEACLELIVWVNIRNIHKMRIVQQMYIWLFLLPVAANALAKLPENLLIDAWGQQIEISTELPFSWQLFYLAAVCFVISNLIYQVRCPRIIKDHPTYATFLDERKGVSHLEWYAKALNAPVTIAINSREQLAQDYRFQQSFWDAHKFGNHYANFSRFFSGLFLLAGFALIGFVLAQGGLPVLRIISRGAG